MAISNPMRGFRCKGGVDYPPRFDSYEDFERWIARSAFAGRHDETMVMLSRTETLAIGPRVRKFITLHFILIVM